MNEVKQLKTFRPLIKKGTHYSSVVIGAPEGFDLVGSLITAKEIKVAIAFGHMSGWSVVSDSIRQSGAGSIQILLGTAFFQTEPALLFELLNLSKCMPTVHVRLASPQITFHPKVWILKSVDASRGIVGSGNLSSGGLFGNTECSMYTEINEDIQALDDWFAYHWSIASESKTSLDEYTKQYEELKVARKFLDEKLHLSAKKFADYEAKLQLAWAIEAARDYWTDEKGKSAIAERQADLVLMRDKLKFPNFDFDGADWIDFIKMSGFGWIRDGYSKKMIADLVPLKAALRLSVKDGHAGLDALMRIYGIGRNIATKLLAVCNSQEFVVCNSPVEAALWAFGIPTQELHKLNSQSYKSFIRHVEPFWQESDALGLDRASALDAFFSLDTAVPRLTVTRK